MNRLNITWLFYLILHSFAAVAQQNPIQLSGVSGHHLNMEEVEPGTYRMETTGTDPYLFSQPLAFEVDKDKSVLTFEYFSTGYLDHLQVFFGPPINENNSIGTSLGVREGWSSHSVDFREAGLENWGKIGSLLRLDFGNAAGYQIQIRNIRFRKPNATEIENARNAQERKKADNAFKQAILNYLEETFPGNIKEVTVEDKSISISGNQQGILSDLFIAEVPMHGNLLLKTDFLNIYPLSIADSDFNITVPRYTNKDDAQSDGLLSKWVLVQKVGQDYKLKSHARYADRVQPRYDLPEVHPTNKKGIGGFHSGKHVSDLDSLGIGSVTVNMWISKMLRSKPSENTITFEYGGKSYYADKEWVEKHDRTIKEAAKRDIVTSAIILIDKAVNTPDKEIGKILEHPDCDPAGIYSMPNLTSEEAVQMYAAAMDFLTHRYSNPVNDLGRVHHWIVHNEVDAGWVWTNMGEKDSLVYMDTYHKSMRLVHNVARQYDAHAKAFISLTHYWNWTQDKHFYHSRDLLEILLQFGSVEGDFEWGIAHHPYPESLFEPKSWLDEKATFDFDTPLITFKNIEVLDAWVKQPYTMYHGVEKRTVFLSEQGPNSKDYSTKNLMEQAASMAYVWKKLEVLSGIEAFQFHNWMDHRGEGGLRIGLRKFPDDADDPSGKKPVWYVYRDLGTAREKSSIEFAKEIIGITSWEEVRYKGDIK